MTPIRANLIGGERIAGDGVPDVNPSDTGDVVALYARASTGDAERAVLAARAAFPRWSRTSPLLRHDILMRASQEVLARREELGRLLSREEGKTLPEGIGEVTRAGHVLA